MTLKDELDAYVHDAFGEGWDRRNGQKVPTPEELKLSNEAVDLDATILYADLADSTGLVSGYKDWFAAEVYKTYLYCVGKIIRSNGGTITAYDGDRAMAVFIDGSKNSNAVKTALQIRWAVDNLIKPAIKKKYPKTSFVLRQKVGIDTSKVMVARTGIRGSNDLVWVGKSANNAAKLAALDIGYSTYITAASYRMLHDWAKDGGTPKRAMWTDLGSSAMGYQIYGSNWHWVMG
jgi:class 3 adenylate cyclase